MLTYNDGPFIRELYKDCPLTTLERQSNITSISTEKTYREILIKNF